MREVGMVGRLRIALCIACSAVAGCAGVQANPSEDEMAHGERSELDDLAELPLPGGLPHDVTLELPDWSQEDLREFDQNGAPMNLGGGLWPAELWPMMPEPRRLPALKSPVAPPTDPAGTAEATEPIPLPVRDVYFGALPAESLVDPQSLVSEQREEEISEFVNEAAGQNAGIPMRILVFETRQKLPEDLALKAQADRWFGAGDGFIAAYFIGRPQRAILMPSSSLAARYAAEQLAGIRDSAVREAQVVSQPEEQLARFCIKAAVRIYQLQKEGARNPPTSRDAVSASVKSRTGDARIAWAAVLVGIAAVLGWWIWHVQRRERKEKSTGPWLLPDQDIIPRLGAPHCGGHAAVVKFKAAKS